MEVEKDKVAKVKKELGFVPARTCRTCAYMAPQGSTRYCTLMVDKYGLTQHEAWVSEGTYCKKWR